jgi:hypothetical protein
MIPLPQIRQYSASGDPLQWPTFDEDPRVLQTWWSGHMSQQTQLIRTLGFSWRRMAGAGFRGVALGILLVGFICGLVPAYSWWLGDWHWVFGLAGIGVATLLLGSEGAVLALAGIALVQAFARVVVSPESALIWLAAGIVGRTLFEWLLIAMKR